MSCRVDNKKVYLSMANVTAIESVLSKGDRVEVIPVKDGVKVMRVKREDVTGGQNKRATV